VLRTYNAADLLFIVILDFGLFLFRRPHSSPLRFCSEPAEEYTARLQFLHPPSDTEYCNKAIDPPLEVCLVDMEGHPILDRAVDLRIVV
jgi:hypothetical protein